MSNTYVIQWKSKVNGRAGRGTKHFSLEDAERLVDELNHEYPTIHHELMDSESFAGRQTERTAENVQETTPAYENENDNQSYESHAFPE
jgi:hypothetical protein